MKSFWQSFWRKVDWREVVPGALSVFGFLLLWEGMIRIFKVPPWILPAPSAVVQALISDRQTLLAHSQVTLVEAVSGFSLSIVLSIVIATIIDRLPLLRATFYPLFVISQTVPIIAVAPLVVVWFGYGTLPKILVVLLVTFFPLTVSLAEGYRSVDQQKVRLLKTMGARPWHIFIYARWPSALPQFFSGLKIAATYSVMGAVIGEWLGARAGLGIYLVRTAKSFLTDRLFAAIAVIVVLSLVLFAIVEGVQRVSLRWLRV
ncbi:MAG: Hydroxymethylpyrimidine ABC transporter, transmembrane component [Candidatus Carbobacillus altaicus]|uniref:Hydroxymethylpyrimidine ABC transporter, transmembrane component n=1 Tax=Candidatus Carbonibacillus altaicus TaxID=2163959 RepID=A0A2R6XYZ2_9BACL|nr:MAG: Hydroxymethylpyrimidine ABC transporter, transmembrane component [Candidatus Carbobacillus altaicus]